MIPTILAALNALIQAVVNYSEQRTVDANAHNELMEQLIERLSGTSTTEDDMKNCNCGCGCGCGGISAESLPSPTDEYPLAPVPSSEPPQTPVADWRCDAANQLYSDWFQLFTEFRNQIIFGNGTAAAIIGIAGFLAVITGGLSVVLALLAGAAGAGAATSLEWVKEWLEHHKEGLICVIASSSSPAQASSNIAAYIDANANTPLGNVSGFFIRNQLSAVAQDTDWNLIFTPGSMEIASSNVGSDCSGCGVSIPPASVTGYEWRRPSSLTEAKVSPSTTSKLISFNSYEFDGTILTAATTWDPKIRANKPGLNPGETIVGFTFAIAESWAIGDSSPATGYVQVENISGNYNGPPPYRRLNVATVHRAALENAAAFDDIVELSNADAALERQTDLFVRIGAGGSVPATARIRMEEIYYAIKLP